MVGGTGVQSGVAVALGTLRIGTNGVAVGLRSTVGVRTIVGDGTGDREMDVATGLMLVRVAAGVATMTDVTVGRLKTGRVTVAGWLVAMLRTPALKSTWSDPGSLVAAGSVAPAP